MIPEHIRVSKAINIHSSKEVLFDLIRNQEKWPQWHPAFMPGNKMKDLPEIKITKLTENDSSILFKFSQGNKIPVLNGWQVYRLSSDSLTLQWYMDFHIKWYPWQKFGSMFYENTYGVMMQEGLSNIKKIVEGQN